MDEALTHSSRKGASRKGASRKGASRKGASRKGAFERAPDNERLEFLGDRVLGLVIAETLLARYPEAREGALAPRLNALVRKETLAEIAEALALTGSIRLAKNERLETARPRQAILADACEAVIAAIYLDGGLAAARAFILKNFGPRLEALAEVPRDPKTALQEWAQGRGLPPPHYSVAHREGPDHAPHFKVLVRVEGFAPEGGAGPSKRLAEQAAAEALLARENLLAPEKLS